MAATAVNTAVITLLAELLARPAQSASAVNGLILLSLVPLALSVAFPAAGSILEERDKEAEEKRKRLGSAGKQDVDHEIRGMVGQVAEGLQEVLERLDTADPRQARSGALADAAKRALKSRVASPEVAVALAIESLRMSPGVEGDIAVRQILRGVPERRVHVRLASRVLALAFSPDGNRLAAACNDATACVLDFATGELSRMSWDRPVTADPTGMDDRHGAAAGDTRWVLGAFEGITQISDEQIDKEEFLALWGAVTVNTASPDGTWEATGAGDGTVRVLSAVTKLDICRINLGRPVTALAFSSDGRQMAAATSDGTVWGLDMVPGDQQCFVNHGGTVAAVALSPDGSRLATGGRDGKIRMFEVPGGKEIWTAGGTGPWGIGPGGSVQALAFSQPDSRLIIGCWGGWPTRGSVQVLDAATGTERWGLHGPRITWTAITPDGEWIAAGDEWGSASACDTATGKQRQMLYRAPRRDAESARSAPPAPVPGTVPLDKIWPSRLAPDLAAKIWGSPWGAQGLMAICPDRTRLACSEYSTRVTVVEASTREELCRLDNSGGVTAISFSPRSDPYMAVGCADGIVLLFDTDTRQERWRLDHGDRVNALAFSPKGTMIVTAGSDGTARVVDAATGRELSQLKHDVPVVAVALSDNGWLAVGCADGTARVWAADHERLIMLARKRQNRDLTPQERQRYFGSDDDRNCRAT